MKNKNLVINNIGLIIRPNIDHDSLIIISNLIGWLTRRKKKVFISPNKLGLITPFLKKNSSLVLPTENKDIFKKSDMIIALGGDGTFISTARNIKKMSLPVLGINLGNLGFTTEFAKTELYEAVESVLKGKFETYKLSLFKATICTPNGKNTEYFFVNDVVIGRKEVSRLINLSVNSDKETIYNLKGDGLIISSPLGSTAYSLAAGGPILHPDSKSMVITPICPHSLNFRPLVVPQDIKIKIQPIEQIEKIQITLDGQEAIEIPPGTHVNIEKSKKRPIDVIKNSEKTFFFTLRNKLTLGKK